MTKLYQVRLQERTSANIFPDFQGWDDNITSFKKINRIIEETVIEVLDIRVNCIPKKKTSQTTWFFLRKISFVDCRSSKITSNM